jgi:hypothetical protein
MYFILAFASLALLLAIVALTKERRLRLALQDVLRRLIQHWRSHAHHQNQTDSDSRSVDIDRRRL